MLVYTLAVSESAMDSLVKLTSKPRVPSAVSLIVLLFAIAASPSKIIRTWIRLLIRLQSAPLNNYWPVMKKLENMQRNPGKLSDYPKSQTCENRMLFTGSLDCTAHCDIFNYVGVFKLWHYFKLWIYLHFFLHCNAIFFVIKDLKKNLVWSRFYFIKHHQFY